MGGGFGKYYKWVVAKVGCLIHKVGWGAGGVFKQYNQTSGLGRSPNSFAVFKSLSQYHIVL